MWGRGMGSFGVRWPWFSIFAGIVVLIGAVVFTLNRSSAVAGA
jgi:hypothetical protein